MSTDGVFLNHLLFHILEIIQLFTREVTHQLPHAMPHLRLKKRSLPAPESAEAEDKSFAVAGNEFVCGPPIISPLSKDIVS